jgi:hypothetical protein
MTMPAKPVRIKKRNRPDGLSIEQYKGYEKWSCRRWAWEFLRRDEDFIRACALVDLNKRTEQDVAAEFQLLTFKHCNKKFQTKTTPAPRYAVNSVKKWANIKGPETEDSNIRCSSVLQSGQVLLKFDLNHEFLVNGSLNAQLRVAKATLLKTLETISTVRNEKPPKKMKPQREIFVSVIRKLDAAAAQDTIVGGLATLEPAKFSILNSAESNKLADKMMRTARKYAKSAYLSLVVRASN